ncbi:hypothetical protein PCASD_25288 [Puccinia coronata f. sp. avenae]|uniref:Uncharacterized protein n=1 Tax=Puccinia coronata f. sp. avenae TaxID=200324 RepID=A0A2N5S0D2_9BASI|nr:hypothetical protein PCASD_25288 [Puccinia coronata f. sp. avenae]
MSASPSNGTPSLEEGEIFEAPSHRRYSIHDNPLITLGNRLYASARATVVIARFERLARLARRHRPRRAAVHEERARAEIRQSRCLTQPRRHHFGRRPSDGRPSTAPHRETRTRGFAGNIDENVHFDRFSNQNAAHHNRREVYQEQLPQASYPFQPFLPPPSHRPTIAPNHPPPQHHFSSHPPVQGAGFPPQSVCEHGVITHPSSPQYLAGYDLTIQTHQAPVPSTGPDYPTPPPYPSPYPPYNQSHYPPHDPPPPDHLSQPHYPPSGLQPVEYHRESDAGNYPYHGESNAQQHCPTAGQPGPGHVMWQPFPP